jgi:hypothetical protein
MPFFLKPLVIINYYVYRFYQRWEGAPIGWTMRLVTLFFSFNIIVLLTLLGKISVLAPKGNYYALTLPLMAVLALVNYVLIFKGDKHYEYFSELENPSKASYRVFFSLYFAITVAPVAILMFNNFPSRH